MTWAKEKVKINLEEISFTVSTATTPPTRGIKNHKRHYDIVFISSKERTKRIIKLRRLK